VCAAREEEEHGCLWVYALACSRALRYVVVVLDAAWELESGSDVRLRSISYVSVVATWI
jgi:hypothetical protein